MSERLDERTEAWPLRPWIMAGICAAAGLLFHFLIDHHWTGGVPVWKQAAATFVVIATVSFVLTVERLRWTWTVGFAVGWGLVLALIGWFTARYNYDATIFEWPYLSGVFAVLLAAPLFQTVRDEGAWRFPYRTLHSHAWTDAVIGAAALFFVGVVFLLAWLIAGLFNLIGIEAIRDLLQKEWFGWMLAGFAFGSAVGLLRERDKLVATLQRLVMVVFSVLAPVLAVSLAAFLASIPFTGLSKFWDSWVPATPTLLAAGVGAILLANAVIGDGREERSSSKLLRVSALVLVAVVLPLAALAALSMQIRIGQYGWTPERIWGVVAVLVAVAYGLAAWWSIWRGRLDFDDPLRPLQVKMAIGLCGVALLLALPILDFGWISARSQIARLESGKIAPDKFDWTAMAFDFGPAGRARLKRIAASGGADRKDLARAALNARDRYRLREATAEQTLDQRVRLLSPDIKLTPALRDFLTTWQGCGDEACVLMRIDQQRLLLLTPKGRGENRTVTASVVDLQKVEDRANGKSSAYVEVTGEETPPVKGVDLSRATVEIRQVQKRQAFIDGKPVGEPFR